jgi:phosphoribosylpyrophosphate synthetase
MLAARKASRISIVSGYFPHSRSDKDEGEMEVAIPPIIMGALHGVAQGLLKRFICADPHSLQVTMADDPGIITPIFLTEKILGYLLADARAIGHKKICLAFPDDSACKRYESAIAAIEAKLQQKLSVVVTYARRTSSRDKRVKYIVGDTDDLKDALVIALDDETATGGSQINAAREYVQRYQAKEVWAAVTHGVLCEDAPKFFSAPDCPITRLYVTDTIPVKGRSELEALAATGRLHIIEWARDIGLVIFDDHWNESIRGVRVYR